MTAAHELGEHALREHRVGEVEAGELVLMRVRGHRQIVEEPVVERPVILELEGADRVGDALDGIGLAMGEVVARIDRPGGAGARMVRMEDAVEHGVAQIDVARRHVDLRPQHPRAVRELARPHAAEQVEILLDRAVAERTVPAGLGQGAATDPHLLLGLIVHIRLAGFDEIFGPRVELLEVIGGMVEVLAPVEAEPVHVALDGVDELLLLLGRIGVVEAQVAVAAELLGDAEIEADRLGVADVQIAVRLRRKPGDDLGIASAREVALDDVANEIATRFCGFGCGHCLEIPFDPYMHAVLTPAGAGARGAEMPCPIHEALSAVQFSRGKR